MEGYELVFITDPELNDRDLTVVLKKFKKSLKDSGGKLVHEHVWGNRRLAYEIKGFDHGLYHAWYFTGSGETVSELHRQFGYSDNILRNQIVKTNDINVEASFLVDLKKISDESGQKIYNKDLAEDLNTEGPDLIEKVNTEEKSADKKDDAKMEEKPAGKKDDAITEEKAADKKNDANIKEKSADKKDDAKTEEKPADKKDDAKMEEKSADKKDDANMEEKSAEKK